ncbi:MAG TPA: ATP-binding protein [Candidatus Coprovivens excrementavium]|nr:ATP-binding protein [Candidatus Coprovivens excrementavium]
MFGKIKFISGNVAHVETVAKAEELGDLMNVHVVFEAPNQEILGEVEEVTDEVIKIRFLGEFVNGKYVSGVIRKPVLSSNIRTINDQELNAIVGVYDDTTFKLGRSSIYTDYDVCVDINNLFANHMAVFGNTGSGKSCGVARVVQNIFSNPNLVSYNANIFIFDAYGEYKTAFKDLGKLNPNYTYKFITTNMQDETDYEMKIPFHLLNLDDLTIMLQADKHSQIPILERALKLTRIFSKDDEVAEKYKNHLIAKALIAILYSNQITANKKNEIFKVLEVCHTNDFNFGSIIQGLGYTRTLSECFEIDSNGNFGESVLITDYILSHIDEEMEMTEEPMNCFYSMRDFAAALEFTLISEGFQNNEQLYDDSMLLKVRLNSIINSRIANIYKCDTYISTESYIASLVAVGNKKAQVINMNLEDIDDTQAKIIVKIIARIFFDFCKTRKQRAQIPFHLFLEEAHRYVQKDADVFLIGYNIFDRIAKEGRKYGVLLNIISQRPVEISETVIAQCSNFLIFKMTHPKDIEYIRTMLPNISADVIEKQKILQPGNCVGFGGAFKLPMVIKMEMPNPAPNSNSCDVNNCWKVRGNTGSTTSSTNNQSGNGGGTPNMVVKPMPQQAQTVNPAMLGNYQAPVQNQGGTTIKPNFVPPVG